MIAFTQFRHGKRSVVLAGVTPADAALLREAITLCGDQKFYIMEESEK